jgi:hypothetical protein
MRRRLFLICRALALMIFFGNLARTGLGQECPVSTMVRISTNSRSRLQTSRLIS